VRRIAALALALTLTACAGGQKPPASPPGAAPTAAPPIESVPTPEVPAPPVPPGQPRPTASVSGTVTYRLRIALTPEAEVQIELRDVSKQDVEAPLIAKRLIAKPGQVPIAFTLDYDPTLVEPGHTYAISARITDRGQLQFVTDTRVGVLGGAATGTPLEIVVVPVR
jgi:putative lipoprotein